ncbi:MAG: rod shape-determining protein RodA [Eggerthellaceae bacterium]|nr:rod shape-determining protein RodA [Eggerthellaceae bacterium]
MAQLPEIGIVKAPEPGSLSSSKKLSFKFFNLPLLITIALLAGYGLLIVWSAILHNNDYSFTRQASGVAAGVVLMLIVWAFDYRRLSDFMIVLLVINVLLILSPHFPVIGVNAKGATSWISLFGIQAQPAEFAKVTVILLCASAVGRYGGKLDDPKEYLKTLGIMLVPFVCIMTQPDLGTGLVYLFIVAVAMVMGGARLKYLVWTLVAAIALLALLLAFDEILKGSFGEYKLVKDYQRARLTVFIDQDYAHSAEGYNLNQAKIAIGSGGLFGKGLLNATQSTLGFLPEAPTDFIFCVLAEQLGFLGVLALLGLYLALVLICFRIARGTHDIFGMLIVMCVVGMWLFQILENIGMTCGLMPITGIPLPFMSYGSSFMVVNFVMLGFIGSVGARSTR